MDSCLQKVCVPFHRQELLLGSGSFARDLAFTFKWGHVTESMEYRQKLYSSFQTWPGNTSFDSHDLSFISPSN